MLGEETDDLKSGLGGMPFGGEIVTDEFDVAATDAMLIAAVHNESSITRLRRTARLSRGPKRWDTMKPSACFKKRSRKKRLLTSG